MVLEWLDENALRAYPFAQGSVVPFSDSMILDMQLTPLYLNEALQVKNIEITRLFANSALTIDWLITFSDNTTLPITDVLSAPFVALKAYAWVNASFTGKLVISQDFITAINAGFNYTGLNIKIADQAVLLHMPRVTAIGFYNTDTLLENVTTVPTLEGGFNTDLDSEDNGLEIAIAPGNGTGLYDNCNPYPDAIISINNITANTLGNFFFQWPDCYYSIPLTDGLHLENFCTGNCTQQQMANLAHYINRITDGEVKVGAALQTQGNNLAADIGTYNTIHNAKSVPNYKVYKTYMSFPSYRTAAYLFMLYNPGPGNITCSLTSTATAGTIVDPSKGVAVPGSAPGVDGDSNIFESNISNATIPCYGYVMASVEMMGVVPSTDPGAIGVGISVAMTIGGHNYTYTDTY